VQRFVLTRKRVASTHGRSRERADIVVIVVVNAFSNRNDPVWPPMASHKPSAKARCSFPPHHGSYVARRLASSWKPPGGIILERADLPARASRGAGRTHHLASGSAAAFAKARPAARCDGSKLYELGDDAGMRRFPR